MIKSSKGITLISLIITIAIMLIIASITVTTSLDRFEINNLNKMINDIKFLEEKVSNYYLKYKGIPVVRDSQNNAVEYTSILNFTNEDDSGSYYIIDLSAMGEIALNYGKGFADTNNSDDLYIINEKTHNIYYVRGIEMNGEYYHTILNNNNSEDKIPPTTPEIKIISGEQKTNIEGEVEENTYITDVELEIVPGKDNWSGVNKTTYYYTFTDKDNNESTVEEIEMTGNNVIRLTEEGTYKLTLKTYDNNGYYSEIAYEIVIEKIDIQQISENVISNQDIAQSELSNNVTY